MLDLDLRKSPLVSVGSPQFAADLTNADGPQGIAGLAALASLKSPGG
jgi:hypothetical protein